MSARERAVELRAHLTDGERWTAYHDEDAGRPCVDSAARGDHRSRFIVAEVCSDSAEDAALIAAAPDLAATVVALSDELATARRAAALAEAERDVLRELTDGMRVDNVRLRAIVAGRVSAPTDAEVAAHTRAGGMWLVTWAAIAGAGLLDGPAAVRAADSARRGGYAVPVTRWVAVLEGRPTTWPTTGDAAGEAGRATGGEGHDETAAAMRERCAAACDAIANDPLSRIEEARGADYCAEAIRALPTTGGGR